MSTCPEKDLYAAFIDGEITSPWLEEIEGHLSECSTCSSQVRNMRKLQKIIRDDSLDLNLSQQKIDDSYKILQNHIKFRQNTASTTAHNKRLVLKFTIPAAAAAAVLVAALLPLRFTNSQNSILAAQSVTGKPSRAQLINTKGIIVEDDLSQTYLSSFSKANGNQIAVSIKDSELAQVDIFRPDFSTAQPQIHIKLTNVTEMPLMANLKKE